VDLYGKTSSIHISTGNAQRQSGAAMPVSINTPGPAPNRRSPISAADPLAEWAAKSQASYDRHVPAAAGFSSHYAPVMVPHDSILSFAIFLLLTILCVPPKPAHF